MKDRLAHEIEEKMDRFFKTVSDDEFVAFLEDLDWEHYASLGSVPSMEPQYSMTAKSVAEAPPKPWDLRHRSVLNKNPSQDRLAA